MICNERWDLQPSHQYYYHYLHHLLNHTEFYSIITLTNIINNGTANILQIAKSLTTITTMTEKTCNKAY